MAVEISKELPFVSIVAEPPKVIGWEVKVLEPLACRVVPALSVNAVVPAPIFASLEIAKVPPLTVVGLV